MNVRAQRPRPRRPGSLLCGVSSLLAAMTAAHPTPISPANGDSGVAAQLAKSPPRLRGGRPRVDRRRMLPEGEARPPFPPGCTWECYLENYPAIAKHVPHTEEAASNHWANVGAKKGRDCSCKEGGGGTAAPNQGADEGGEVEVTEEVMEDVEAAFPPGCSWECYLGNYIDLSEHFHTEDEALRHYLQNGIKESRDCTCKDDTEITDQLLKGIEEVEEQLKELDFQDDDSVKSAVEQQKETLEEKEQELIKDSFPPGCSWECYLANYVNLSKKIHTEEQALNNYLHAGIKNGRDCTCKDDTEITDESLKEIEEVEEQLKELDFQDDDSVKSTVERQKEILEEKEEEMIQDSFPPGCSWKCYLANSIHLSEHLHTEEAALRHYLHSGIKHGRDCTCKEPKEAATDDTVKEINEVEEELIRLDFQDDDTAEELTSELELLREELRMVKEHQQEIQHHSLIHDIGDMITWMIIVTAPIVFYIQKRRQRYASFQKVATEEHCEEPSEVPTGFATEEHCEEPSEVPTGFATEEHCEEPIEVPTGLPKRGTK